MLVLVRGPNEAWLPPPPKAPARSAPLPCWSSTTKISVNDEHIDDLVNYVVARAYMNNANFAGNDNKAAQFVAQFTSSLNAKVIALTGNNPNLQRLPLAPEPIAAAS